MRRPQSIRPTAEPLGNIASAVIAIAQELQTPVKFVGVGEGADDLRPFDAREFLQELF